MRLFAAFVLILFAVSVETKKVHKSRSKPTNSNLHESTQNRNLLLSFLRNFLSYVLGERSDDPNRPSQHRENELSILTWNILGQIFVDVNSLNESGVVDTNLLDRDIRLDLVINRILENKADIITLQEVQPDTYDIIKNTLGEVYAAHPFAPNGPNFVGNFQVELAENGQATLYNKNKFTPLSSEVFYVSDDDNAAQISVIRRTRSGSPNDAFGPPIVVANCHFGSGFETANILLRISQGYAITELLSNVTEELRETYPTFEPVVIIAGDFNSFTSAPGLENIKSKGYTDVKEMSGNTLDTIFFTRNITVPLLPPFNGLSIDKILVPTSDFENGRIVVESTSVPDVRKDPDLDEKQYIKRVLNMVIEDLLLGKINGSESSRRLEILLDSLTDGKQYDTVSSRVLRLGSDHAPLLALLEIMY